MKENSKLTRFFKKKNDKRKAIVSEVRRPASARSDIGGRHTWNIPISVHGLFYKMANEATTSTRSTGTSQNEVD